MITFDNYAEFGFSLIPETEFKRYSARARLTAQKYTFGRIDEDNLTDNNKFGLCELCELFYSDDNQINKPIMSFSNNGYSETYGSSGAENIQTVDDRVYSIIQTYFSTEQLYRGA